MIKIGITGGIGSGKSVVASLFSLFDVPVYIADEESKKLVDVHPGIRSRLVGLFGNEIYTSQGLNRKLLASYIFGDAGNNLCKVNEIIHPEVNRHFLSWAENLSSPACAIESAILFESGFDSIVDVRLMVYAPLEVRICRVMERDHIERESVERRIKAQMSDEEKKDRSDYVIFNDEKKALIPQVENFLRKYGLTCF